MQTWRRCCGKWKDAARHTPQWNQPAGPRGCTPGHTLMRRHYVCTIMVKNNIASDCRQQILLHASARVLPPSGNLGNHQKHRDTDSPSQREALWLPHDGKVEAERTNQRNEADFLLRKVTSTRDLWNSEAKTAGSTIHGWARSLSHPFWGSSSKLAGKAPWGGMVFTDLSQGEQLTGMG